MTPDEQTVERDELLADLDAQSAEDGNIAARAAAAQETCSKIQRRDYETSAIVHSYAADAIAALLIEGATND